MDFTHPDATFRQQQIDLEKNWIDMASALGTTYCRILTGKRRPDVSRSEGIAYSIEGITASHEHAVERNITLILD